MAGPTDGPDMEAVVVPLAGSEVEARTSGAAAIAATRELTPVHDLRVIAPPIGSSSARQTPVAAVSMA